VPEIVGGDVLSGGDVGVVSVNVAAPLVSVPSVAVIDGVPATVPLIRAL
jgi:hypothetical protein